MKTDSRIWDNPVLESLFVPVNGFSLTLLNHALPLVGTAGVRVQSTELCLVYSCILRTQGHLHISRFLLDNPFVTRASLPHSETFIPHFSSSERLREVTLVVRGRAATHFQICRVLPGAMWLVCKSEPWHSKPGVTSQLQTSSVIWPRLC